MLPADRCGARRRDGVATQGLQQHLQVQAMLPGRPLQEHQPFRREVFLSQREQQAGRVSDAVSRALLLVHDWQRAVQCARRRHMLLGLSACRENSNSFRRAVVPSAAERVDALHWTGRLINDSLVLPIAVRG